MADKPIISLQARRTRTELREKAHLAVMHFDRKPDLANALAALDALKAYSDNLRQGEPVSIDERFAFERRWDARVEEGRKRDG